MISTGIILAPLPRLTEASQSWFSAPSCDIIKRMPATGLSHDFQTDDPRLALIHEKVLAREWLYANDAMALYRSGDILAVGLMANSVREHRHGEKTYFNVNRHIN